MVVPDIVYSCTRVQSSSDFDETGLLWMELHVFTARLYEVRA